MGSTGSGRFSDYSGIISPGRGSGPGAEAVLIDAPKPFHVAIKRSANLIIKPE